MRERERSKKENFVMKEPHVLATMLMNIKPNMKQQSLT